MNGEHKTIVGVCEKVERPPGGDGFHKFHIKVEGFEYPFRLSTKKHELINAADNAGTQRAVWGFLEQQGNPNPNKPGTFYLNRYLDSVVVDDKPAEESIAETAAAPHPAESADAPPPPVDWDAKDLRKHRQAAVAIAVSRAASLPEPESIDVFALAETITQFVYRKVEYAEPEELAAGLTVDDETIPF